MPATSPSPSITALHRPGAASDVFAGAAPVGALAPPPAFARLRTRIGLPELGEVDVVRHFTRLSRQSHGVDNGPYPLGSCTMKYNPKRNDELARLPGFACAHPLQDADTLAGLWELYARLQDMLCEITGMQACCLAPAAGAHGEWAGLLMVRRHFAQTGAQRTVVLVPDSAHGTNPASAAMAGFDCRIVPTDLRGRVDLAALRAQLTPEVAALMLTNPSTLGLFEDQIAEIAAAVHAAGALLYYDGANLNALLGVTRPGDMGFDLVHVNLHKTFSTPHGGGGPGAGPVAANALLAPYLPAPVVVRRNGHALPDDARPLSIGRIKAFHGHVAVLLRAYGYLRSMGARGLRQAAENAVLNANYLQHRLAHLLPPVYGGQACMHEALLSGARLPCAPRDFARRLIAHAIHPPTLVGAGCVYFPGALRSAMLIEPTETESRASLDRQVQVFQQIFDEAAAGGGAQAQAQMQAGTQPCAHDEPGDLPCVE